MITFIISLASFIVGLYIAQVINNERVEKYKKKAEDENRGRAQWQHRWHEEKVKNECLRVEHRRNKAKTQTPTHNRF